MPGISTSDVDKLMGIRKLKLIDIVPKHNFTAKLFKTVANLKMEGGKVFVPLTLATAHTAGPSPLIEVDAPKFDEATFNFGHAYTTMEFTDEAFERMLQDEGFAIKSLLPWLDMSKDNLLRYLATTMWTINQGQLAKVSAISGDKKTLTILPLVANVTLYPYDAVKYFRKNMLCDIYGGDPVIAHATKVKVDTINPANGTITFTASVGNTVAQNDIIYWHGTYVKKPSPGIPDMVNDKGLYGTINREEWPDYASYIQRAPAGQQLDTDMLDNLWYETQGKGGQEEDESGINIVLTSGKVCQKYKKLFNFVVNVPQGTQGVTAINAGVGEYWYTPPGGKPVKFQAVPFVPEGTLWGLRKANLYQFYARQFKWLEYGRGNSGLEKYFEFMGRIKGESQLYRAMGSQLYNYFTDCPAVHAAILDIDVRPEGS